MKLARFAPALLALLLAVPAWGQERPEIFPLSQVQPGLKGVGRTIFAGDKIEEFQVEIVGVLQNALAPKHSVILARLTGGPLEKTGVIAGMSGSPVYVDGKLVGAVALSFPFSKEPYAGITPIEDMLDVVPAPLPAPARTKTASLVPLRIVRTEGGAERLIPEEGVADLWKQWLPAAQHPSGLSGLRLPLRYGGFSSSAMQDAASVFEQMGLEPMEGVGLSGGTAGGGALEPSKPDQVVPGSMVSVVLVRGDLNLNVDCTVTLLEGDRLYACGHRFLLTGPVDFPFAPAHVLATIPNLASSFKVDSVGTPVGAIRQDRFGAIYGVLGQKSELIPVHIRLDSTLNREQDYHFQMVQQSFLSPFLLNLALVSAVSATERMVGPATLNVKGDIRLASGEKVSLEDVVSSDFNAANLAAGSVVAPLTYLLGSEFPDLRVAGIDLDVKVSNEKRLASIEQAWSSQAEVRPGDRIEVTAVLRMPSGEAVVEKIPVTIPESVRDKTLSLVLGSGATINALENRFAPLGSTPRDLAQLVRALNRLRRNNRLYALLMAPQSSFVMQGDEYPSPPPSLVQTFLADPAVSSSVVFRGTSVVGDFETAALPYAIRGQKTLMLKVTDTGP